MSGIAGYHERFVANVCDNDFCYVCQRDVQGHNARSHCEGRAHREACEGDLGQIWIIEDRRECDLCSVKVNSRASAESHYNGARHQAAVRATSTQNPPAASAPGGPRPPPTPRAAAAPTPRTAPRSDPRAAPVISAPPPPAPVRNWPNLFATELLAITDELRDHALCFVCVREVSSHNAESHCAGRAHREALDGELGQIWLMEHRGQCCLCMVEIQSRESAVKHCRGARHQTNLRQQKQPAPIAAAPGSSSFSYGPTPFAAVPAASSSSSSSCYSSPSQTWEMVAVTGEGITITNDFDTCNTWVEDHVNLESLTAVGIDTESALVDFAPNQLALIQVATISQVLLFRVHGLKRLPRRLARLLEDSFIHKYSFGPERGLAGLCTIDGNVDLQRAFMIDHEIRQFPSLQKVADTCVPELRFIKNPGLTKSNWAAWPLSSKQTDYAASDAIAALAIGHAISRARARSRGPLSHVPSLGPSY